MLNLYLSQVNRGYQGGYHNNSYVIDERDEYLDEVYLLKGYFPFKPLAGGGDGVADGGGK